MKGRKTMMSPVPSLEDLLAGPRRFAEFAETYSAVCKKHGGQSLRTFKPKPSRKKTLPIYACCQKTIELWQNRGKSENPPIASLLGMAIEIRLNGQKLEPCCQGTL